jgi:FKBP-type peptidyl-prolyl cis-trans isomerase FkpA
MQECQHYEATSSLRDCYNKRMTKYEGTKLPDFDPRDSVETLEIIDSEVGIGETVNPGATITAHYTGALCKNGIIFQSSHDFGNPITFGLDQVIKGWTEGVPGMKVGGTRRLLIPSEQAYGSARAASNIPPNSDLVFDIELVAIPQNG